MVSETNTNAIFGQKSNLPRFLLEGLCSVSVIRNIWYRSCLIRVLSRIESYEKKFHSQDNESAPGRGRPFKLILLVIENQEREKETRGTGPGDPRGAKSSERRVGSSVRPGISPDVTIEDDGDDWRGIQSAFNEILVQRARMNNRPCERAGRPSWWRVLAKTRIHPASFGFSRRMRARNVIRAAQITPGF